ncbi:MAG: hypothetical protein EZS28_022751 [Streblomastix strix]|uniref:SPRY domain-containing protein n=1 Tax=Streblomastix strix TaxID=222440 RepID=A0A5J4VH82_9EUKA|nr:MAG: hypothetical protein EZS28_022751 [Streblomastix strix]
MREVSDDGKIQSLIALIGLAVSFESTLWHGIVSESGVIEVLSALMIETTNPKIRTLCSAIIHIIEQRGTEVGESADWKSILSPLISLLQNKDEQISKTGKSSLIDAIGSNPEISQALIKLGLFDISSEVLELAFPSFSSSSSDTILPQMVILNILEVVDKILKRNEESIKEAKQFKSCSERIIKMKLPRPIKLAIQSILIAIEGDSNGNNEEILQTQLREAQERIRTLEEQARIGQQREREKDEQIKKEKDEQIRNSEEHSRNQKKMKRDAQEQLRLKDAEIQHIKTEYTRQLSIIMNLSEEEISNGIHSVSVKFKDGNFSGFVEGQIGIVKASHKIPCPCDPCGTQHNKKMLHYDGHDGDIHFRGNNIEGNTKFSDGQLISMELNMDIGTLHFIVDGVQQPVFVQGIKEKVKYFV